MQFKIVSVNTTQRLRFTKLPATGSNPESPIQILVILYDWIGNSGFEPAVGSSMTFLQFIKGIKSLSQTRIF